jgi:DNA-binding MarR family transcriptional regulator
MLQLSQRPLTASVVDGELFVDRVAELELLHRSYDLRLNTLLLGARGVGVTSLARRFQRQLEDAAVHAFYVDGGSADSVEDLVDAIRRVIKGPGTTVPGSEAIETTIAELADESSGRPPLVIVDGARDPSVIHGLFGRLRDEVWMLPYVWLVCGVASRREEYLRPPADSFFDVVSELLPLSTESGRELLRARLAHAGDADAVVARRIAAELDAIVERGAGNPRHVLGAAREVALNLSGSVGDVLLQASRLGRAEAMLVAELRAFGPSSASNDELLERLGWTRARAAQVFKQLADHGLVTSTLERSAGAPGRPRVVYRLATPAGSKVA